MVSRSTLVVVLVAAVVLLSGCSVLIGGDDSSDPEEFDYAPGYAADGIDDGEQAVESYTQAVQEQGSFTGEYSYDVVTEEGETSVDVDYEVDFDTEEANQTVSVEAPEDTASTESFYTEGQVYQIATFEGEQGDVSVEDREFPTDELTAVEAVQPLLTNASSYNTSVSEHDDTSMVTYETSDVENAEDFFGADEAEEVTEFNAQFTVDSDGIVHTAEYNLEYLFNGEERSVSLTFELTDFGETAVTQPEWVNDA